MGQKLISILGSTGSIGRQVLDICSEFPQEFCVLGLSAGSNISLLARQIEKFRPALVSVSNEKLALELEKMLEHHQPEISYGIKGYTEVATIPEVDTVVSSIVGAAGLIPTYQAILSGKNISIANKEPLVMAGSLIMETIHTRNVNFMPIDSEHSAIFQCLAGNSRSSIKKIILTASGGPFIDRNPNQLANVTVEEALNHPRWKMGKKITIDSATLMNKGLEVIEARWLFDVSPEDIEILVHPESIIHSMVEYKDGSIIAQLGLTDMKLPILYALSYPQRWEHDFKPLDFVKLKKLSFKNLDMNKFPCVQLAYNALKSGGTVPTWLNAANEVAVQSFLDKKIGFNQIPMVIEKALDHVHNKPVHDIETVIEADKIARIITKKIINTLIDNIRQ